MAVSKDLAKKTAKKLKKLKPANAVDLRGLTKSAHLHVAKHTRDYDLAVKNLSSGLFGGTAPSLPFSTKGDAVSGGLHSGPQGEAAALGRRAMGGKAAAFSALNDEHELMTLFVQTRDTSAPKKLGALRTLYENCVYAAATPSPLLLRHSREIMMLLTPRLTEDEAQIRYIARETVLLIVRAISTPKTPTHTLSHTHSHTISHTLTHTPCDTVTDTITDTKRDGASNEMSAWLEISQTHADVIMSQIRLLVAHMAPEIQGEGITFTQELMNICAPSLWSHSDFVAFILPMLFSRLKPKNAPALLYVFIFLMNSLTLSHSTHHTHLTDHTQIKECNTANTYPAPPSRSKLVGAHTVADLTTRYKRRWGAPDSARSLLEKGVQKFGAKKVEFAQKKKGLLSTCLELIRELVTRKEGAGTEVPKPISRSSISGRGGTREGRRGKNENVGGKSEVGVNKEEDAFLLWKIITLLQWSLTLLSLRHESVLSAWSQPWLSAAVESPIFVALHDQFLSEAPQAFPRILSLLFNEASVAAVYQRNGVLWVQTLALFQNYANLVQTGLFDVPSAGVQNLPAIEGQMEGKGSKKGAKASRGPEGRNKGGNGTDCDSRKQQRLLSQLVKNAVTFAERHSLSSPLALKSRPAATPVSLLPISRTLLTNFNDFAAFSRFLTVAT